MTTHNTHNRQTYMRPVGFEPKISAGERPKTYALDRAACVKYHFLSESVSWPAVCTRVQCNVLLNTPNVGPYIYDVSISGFTRSSIYTGCPRRKVPNFGRLFLRSNYTDTHTPTSAASSIYLFEAVEPYLQRHPYTNIGSRFPSSPYLPYDFFPTLYLHLYFS